MEVNIPQSQPTQAKPTPPLPPSSDPRLKRPRPSVTTSPVPRHTSQPSSPATTTPLPALEPTRHPLSRDLYAPALRVQSEPVHKSDGSDFTGKLLDLIDARVSRLIQQQEKSKLEKEEESHRRDLMKAQQAKAFPATIECLQTDSNAYQKRLSRIDHEITQQQNISFELAADIESLFRQNMGIPNNAPVVPIKYPSDTSRNMVRLEDDIRKIKRTIFIEEKGDEFPHKPVDISKVCNAVNSQSTAHISLRKTIIGAEANFTKGLSGVENRLKTLEEAVQKHETSVNALSGEQQSFKTVSSSQKSEFQGQLKALGQELYTSHSQSLAQALSHITNKFADMEQKIKVKNSQSEGRLSSESHSHSRDQVSAQDGIFQDMKETWDDLLRKIPFLSEISEDIKKHVKSYEGLVVCVRSLETRYNNLNTEPLVRQMSNAMQEMYPSARQLNEEVKSIRDLVNQDALGIKAGVKEHMEKLNQLQNGLESLKTALNAQTAKCNATAASSLGSSELAAQLQVLGTETQATQKSIDELRLQLAVEKPPHSSSMGGAIDGAESRELYNEMRSMLENAKADFVKILADVNTTLASDSKILEDTQKSITSRRSQDLSSSLAAPPPNESRPSPGGSGLNTQSLPDPSLPLVVESPRTLETENRLPESPPESGITQKSSNALGTSANIGNKRQREVHSDDDSPLIGAATTTSESPDLSNSDVRMSQILEKKKRKKKKKKTRGFEINDH